MDYLQFQIECPVCLDIYAPKTKTPKNLNCGHTICENCARSLLEGASIKCPTCKKETTSAIADELVTNFATLGLLEAMCDVCHDQKWTKICPNRNIKVCPSCDQKYSEYLSNVNSENRLEAKDLLVAAREKVKMMYEQCNNDDILKDISERGELATADVKQFWDDICRKATEKKDEMKKNITETTEKKLAHHVDVKQQLREQLTKVSVQVDKYTAELLKKKNGISDERRAQLSGDITDSLESIESTMTKISQVTEFDPVMPKKKFDEAFQSCVLDKVAVDEVTENDGAIIAGDGVSGVQMASGTTCDVLRENLSLTESSTPHNGIYSSHESQRRVDNEPIRSADIKRKAQQFNKSTLIGTGSPKQKGDIYTQVHGKFPLTRSVSAPVYSGVMSSVTYGEWGSGKKQFDWPCCVATSPDGGFIVVTDLNNHRVHVLNKNLKFVSTFDTTKCGGKFRSPSGIAVNSRKHVFTTHQNSNIILVTDMTGNFISEIGHKNGPKKFNRPLDIACDKHDTLYVCDRDNYEIKVLKSDGTLLRTFGCKDMGAGHFRSWPVFVAVSKDGIVAVSDDDGHVHTFTSAGIPIATIDGHRYGKFIKATGLAIDAHGNLVVATYEGRLVALKEDRTFIHNLSDPGKERGKLSMPQGLVVTPEGNVVVCDSGNQRMQLFKVNLCIKITIFNNNAA